MVDYHVHPDFSHDASGSVDDFCARAVEFGLEEICFTTHYEPDPRRKDIEFVRVDGRMMPVASDWPTHYFAAIEQARKRFPGLSVLAGVEVGYEPGLEGMIHDFLSSYPFDFVLGAVHCLDSVCLTAHEELHQFKTVHGSRDAQYVAHRYLLHLRAAAGSTLFDSLAHLDIYRKYVEGLFDERFGETIRAGLPEVLKFVARSGTGIEVNTSAFRRGNPEPYPTSHVLHLASDIGVQVFTVGSDAHMPEDLGSGLDRAEEILRGLGVTPARFKRRTRLVRQTDNTRGS
jgi:histidinol-phosphatase (PHP family)